MSRGKKIKESLPPTTASPIPAQVQPQIVSTSSDPSNKDKETAYYSALVNGWLNTVMEKDKSLLSLAAGGVGLLITLVTTVGIQSQLGMWLFGVSLSSFLITIIGVIEVFRRNAQYIKGLFKKSNIEDRALGLLDKAIIVGFISGILFSIGFGITLNRDRLKKQEEMMSGEKVNTRQIISPDDGKSVRGLDDFDPSNSQGSGQGSGQGGSAPPPDNSNTEKK